MQFGFWTRRTTHQAIMCINTMINHAHNVRVSFAISDTDCKSAFDCCIPEIICLGLLSKGMPDNIVTFLHSHLMKTEFNKITSKLNTEEDPQASVTAREVENQAFTGT